MKKTYAKPESRAAVCAECERSLKTTWVEFKVRSKTKEVKASRIRLHQSCLAAYMNRVKLTKDLVFTIYTVKP